MKEVLKNILDWLEPKVSYADLRFVQTEKENIEVENGILSSFNVSTNRGVGIRVLVNSAWGFASSNNLNKVSLQETATKALDVARASALTKKEEIRLAPEDKHVATYITPITKDPSQISPSEKIDLLVKATKIMLKDRVKKSEGSLNFYKTYKIFLSTEGSEIEQTIFESGGVITAYAIDKGDFQKRSYPSSFGGDYSTRGYEFIEEMKLLENAERVAEEANQLLVAPSSPAGIMDIVLGGSQLALQVHESCGHPVELDRVLGKEISYAGGSFLSLDKLNNFTYGSPEVTIVADATVPQIW
ncbi:Metalloprotease TldD [subsurface metagenome]